MSKIIFFELNEVPEMIFRNSFRKNTYNIKLSDLHFSKTKTLDAGHLSPWVTWATVHRGITDKIHNITDINQDISIIDKKYPTIMSSLADKGFKVGVFGSMHSASVSRNEFKKYTFYVPEAFATNSDCKPKTINNLQRLNLKMSKASARVVESSMPGLKLATLGAISYLKHSFRLNGARAALFQLIKEIFEPWKKIRRRTLQSEILFDVYMDLLLKYKPDFSTFFTNHVASNMHRFWEARFPNHYPSKISTSDWKKRYQNEIDIAMKTTSYFINCLTNFVDNNKEYQLWIVSSMGQAAVEDYKPGESFWKIENMKDFLSSICGEELEISELTQMIPCYSAEANENTIKLIHKKLINIESNANLKCRSITKTTIAFSLEAYDIEEIWFKYKTNKKIIKIKGLKKINIDEKSGSSAYHIPEGILYRYGSNLKSIEKEFLDKEGHLLTHNIKKLIENSISR